jgi:hypothetical protein
MQVEDALRRAGVGSAPAQPVSPPAPASAPVAWSKGGRTSEEEAARARALVAALRNRSYP